MSVIKHTGNPYGNYTLGGDPINTNISLFEAIGLGLIEDHSPVYINGFNTTVGVASQIVSPAGNVIPYTHLTADTTLDLVSTSAEDGAGGATGALTVYMTGLDSNYAYIEDTITLNGTGVVNTNVDFFRINTAIVLDSGTADTNVGIIDIKNGAYVLGRIATSGTPARGSGSLQPGMYTVPAGQIMVLCNLFGSSIGGNTSHVHLAIKEFGKSYNMKRHFSLLDTSFGAPFSYGSIVPEKSEIQIVAHSSAVTADLSVGLCGYLRPPLEV